MKNILLIITTSFLLSGCFWQTANNIDLKKAAYFCGGLDKVVEVTISVDGTESVLCLDGNKAWLSDVKIGGKDE